MLTISTCYKIVIISIILIKTEEKKKEAIAGRHLAVNPARRSFVIQTRSLVLFPPPILTNFSFRSTRKYPAKKHFRASFTFSQIIDTSIDDAAQQWVLA